MEAGSGPPAGANSSTYVAPDGSIKPLLPRNVNINQFYPTVPFNDPKERQPAKLGEFVDISPPPAAITDGRERNENQQNNNRETSDSETKENLDDPPDTQTENNDVFTTQVDEETLQAAKDRQVNWVTETFSDGTLFQPENWQVPRAWRNLEEIIADKIESHFRLAETQLEQEDYPAAIRNYTKVILMKPDKDRLCYIHGRRAEAYLQLGDFQSCIANYKRACMLKPDNYDNYSRLAFIYYFYGQTLFDQKLFPEALESFSRAAEMKPEIVSFHTRSIACLAAMHRHGECLALVNKRLEIEHDNADMYIMRARLHQLFRNTTLCYYDVTDALVLAPHHVEANKLMGGLVRKGHELKNLTQNLHLSGRFRDAMQQISIAIETNPSIADYHVLRGALHRKLGDFNASIDDYLLALDKTDHDEEHPVYIESQRQLLLTYNDFAIECFNKGFYEEAIILLNKAIKGEKTEKGLYINRGDCFYKQGDLQFALCDYHQAMELAPTDNSIKARIAIMNNDYGLQEYNDKNYTEAEGRFTVAIQHNPFMADYYISRARVRHLCESSTSARSDLLLALLLSPEHPEVMSVLTRLFPGKSVKEVLASPLGAKARLQLKNLVVTASPVALPPLGEGGQESLPQDKESAESMPPIAGTLWKAGHCVPDLKACMKEHDFNVRVCMEKQVLNQEIRKLMNNPKPLSSPPYRLGSLNAPSPPTSAKPKKGKLAVTTGWRKFTSGIGTA